MLPSTSSWSSNYESNYPASNSLTSFGEMRGRRMVNQVSSSSHWNNHAHRSLESGFVPPAVDLRYQSDWTSSAPTAMNTFSPRPSTAGFPIKDELTDPSDYSSEDTCSDYRDGLSGGTNPDYYRGDLGERSRRSADKKLDIDESMTPEETTKRRVRRERNKMAAARCRQRRVDLTNQLLAETETLEDERDRLQKEIQVLQHQRGQLEDLLGSHAPRCQNSHVMEIPPIKTEKCDDYFNIADTSLRRAQCNNYSHPTTTFQSCSRPDSLPLTRRSACLSSSLSQTVAPSNMAGVTNLGLDCMLDGHTGLTPITGPPSGPDHMARTPVDCYGYSPTTLLTL